jgi:hypothetical protein
MLRPRYVILQVKLVRVPLICHFSIVIWQYKFCNGRSLLFSLWEKCTENKTRVSLTSTTFVQYTRLSDKQSAVTRTETRKLCVFKRAVSY